MHIRLTFVNNKITIIKTICINNQEPDLNIGCSYFQKQNNINVPFLKDIETALRRKLKTHNFEFTSDRFISVLSVKMCASLVDEYSNKIT